MIYPRVDSVKACLDALVYFANPREKDAAHITLRGPSTARNGLSQIADRIVGARISIVGADSFFEGSQNTVFLRCGADEIKKYWNKPEYPFNPHLTIYDGDSREFARSVLLILEKNRLFFEIVVGECRIVNSVPGQKSMQLALEIEKKMIEEMTDEDVELDSVSRIPEWRRLMFIDRICNHLVWHAKKSVTTNSRIPAGTEVK
jgi:hypothetical protein